MLLGRALSGASLDSLSCSRTCVEVAANMTGSSSRLLLELGAGGDRTEVDANDDLDALAQHAEAAFDLHPGSYELFDAFGKVETAAALQRSIAMAGDEPCVLEVREQPVWQKLRAMEARLESCLAAAEPAAQRAPAWTVIDESFLEAIEERVLAKTEADIADLRADLVETNHALRDVYIDCAGGGPAPTKAATPVAKADFDAMVQQIETMGEEIQGLRQQCQFACAWLPSFHQGFQGLQAEMHQALALTDADLRQEMQSMRDVAQDAQRDVKTLQADLRQCEQRSATLQEEGNGKRAKEEFLAMASPIRHGTWTVPYTTALDEDLKRSKDCIGSPQRSASGGGGGGHTIVDPALGFAYSSKTPLSGAALAPFARFGSTGGGAIGRKTSGCRSLPQLQPLLV